MPWGFFGNLIFAIIAGMFCENHLNFIPSVTQCAEVSPSMILTRETRVLIRFKQVHFPLQS